MEKILKDSEKEKEIDNMENIMTFSGHLTCKITNGNYVYKEEVEKFLS